MEVAHSQLKCDHVQYTVSQKRLRFLKLLTGSRYIVVATNIVQPLLNVKLLRFPHQHNDHASFRKSSTGIQNLANLWDDVHSFSLPSSGDVTPCDQGYCNSFLSRLSRWFPITLYFGLPALQTGTDRRAISTGGLDSWQ